MNSYQMVLHRPVETARDFGKFEVRRPGRAKLAQSHRAEELVSTVGWTEPLNHGHEWNPDSAFRVRPDKVWQGQLQHAICSAKGVFFDLGNRIGSKQWRLFHNIS